MSSPLLNPAALLARLRQARRSLWLYGGLAAAGGAGAGVLSIYAPAFVTRKGGYFPDAVGFALCGAGVALGLFAAGVWARRGKWPALDDIGLAVAAGTLAGCLAGVVGHFVYSFRATPDWIKLVLLRTSAWALTSALLGWLLAYTVPNLGQRRGIAAGAVGGFLGGIVFLVIGLALPLSMQRAGGFAIVGLALGLCMITIDVLLREASVEVIWGKGESNTLSLGPEPLMIGSGAVSIYVPDLLPRQASLCLSGGRIEFKDLSTGYTTVLRNGSRIKLGRVELLVHAQA